MNLKIVIALVALALAALAVWAVWPHAPDNGGSPGTLPDISTAPKLTLLKKVTLDGGARPEIVEGKDKVFVAYLEAPTPQNRLYRLKTFDKGMNELSSQVLLSKSGEYGAPTDFRLASDGEYAYAFYETATSPQENKAYLWAAKYSLVDFRNVASVQVAEAPYYANAGEGDELVNDPAPVVAGDSVFVVTRIVTGKTVESDTLLKVREFDKSLKLLREFEVDLSSVIGGPSRQNSALYVDGHFYILIPSQTGEQVVNVDVDMAYPSDMKVVKLDSDWNIVDSGVVSSNPGDSEVYATGFAYADGRFYASYKRMEHSPKPFYKLSLPLKAFDTAFNPVYSEELAGMAALGGSGGSRNYRPSLFAKGGRLYFGNDGSGVGEVSVYKVE